MEHFIQSTFYLPLLSLECLMVGFAKSRNFILMGLKARDIFWLHPNITTYEVQAALGERGQGNEPSSGNELLLLSL